MNTSAEDPALHAVAILAVLNRHSVHYLIVGGVAANAYGAARPTQDLDCVVEIQRANLVHLAEALKELGGRLRAKA